MERTCLNCSTALRETDQFCPNCGQKDAPVRITFRQLVGDLLGNILAWDNRFFRSVKQLIYPASLTVLFFEGKKESYIPPIRLYLFTVILHLAVINFFSTNSFFKISDEDRTSGKELVRLKAELNAIHSVRDSLKRLADLDHHAIQILDSTYTGLDTRFRSLNDTIQIHILSDQETIEYSLYDLEVLPLDSLNPVNKDRTWWSAMVRTQFVKTYRNPKALTSFVVARLSWMMFLIIPFVALILTGLYINKRHYFVEHLVFSLHYHVAAYLIVSLGIILDSFKKGGGWTALTVVIALCYIAIAMKRFYKQSWMMTLFKFSILHMLYLLVSLVLILLLMIASFLLFA